MLNTILCQGWKTSLKLSFNKELEVYLIIESLPTSLRMILNVRKHAKGLEILSLVWLENQTSFIQKK